MKKGKRLFAALALCLCVAFNATAVQGGTEYSGYDGGISSGEAPNKSSYDYQEVCFITGEPLVFKGSLVIKKTDRQDYIQSTYTYSLQNIDRNATLTRIVNFRTDLTKNDKGQTVEKTYLNGRYSEVIRVGNTTYTLTNYEFTFSRLIDPQPAIEYYSGNLRARKTYRINRGGAGAAGNGTVTVEQEGIVNGYKQYWGFAEGQIQNYFINCSERIGERVDSWGGTAEVRLSSTVEKLIDYVENYPTQISFAGGYELKQKNESVLEYVCYLPEFDAQGFALDGVVKKQGSLELETFPVNEMLFVPSLYHLRGYWSEEDIRLLFSLGIFKEEDSKFNPEEYMTRAEFASVINELIRPVPEDTNLKKPGLQRNVKKVEEKVTPSFVDLPESHKYFEPVESVFKKGLMNGCGNGKFAPDGPITLAAALTVFIRAVGLENLAPTPAPVTVFRDNDEIPQYARKAVFVAEKIGLVFPDSRGYLRPNQKLTKGQAASITRKFLEYLQTGIRRDYKEHMIGY